MTLDPDTAAYLASTADGTPYHQMASPAEAREAYREVVRMREAGKPSPWPACSTEEFITDGVRLRLYRPLGRSVHEPPLPLVVFFHGGGWVIGDINTHDGAARALAAMPANVVSVDYRLAPEHASPAQLEDCWTATMWAARQIGLAEVNPDPLSIKLSIHSDRLVVAGDSAGGHLAAAMAVRARDEGGPEIDAQLLIYPALDPTMSQPSYERLATGYGLTAEGMAWFYDQVAPGDGFSPWDREDLAGLPPAVVTTAEYDPLSDEGRAYAQRLRDAGVRTVTAHFEGLVHGYFTMSGFAATRAATEATVAALRGLLG